jgi:hypothetical protein
MVVCMLCGGLVRIDVSICLSMLPDIGQNARCENQNKNKNN